MKLKEKISNLLKKLPKAYKQIELIKLKTDLVKEIKRTEVLQKHAKESNDSVNFLLFKKLRGGLVRDQKKIKLAITKNNSRLLINNLIYKREEIAKEAEFLQIISKNKEQYSDFFKKLKDNNFIIETDISKLKNKLQKIEKKLEKRNNSFLTKTLLMLETV